MHYLEEIALATRRRHTRRELREIFRLRTMRDVPADANLREYVSRWYAQQQGINDGMKSPPFWCGIVGIKQS